MIIFLLILFVILAFLSIMLIKEMKVRVLATVLSFAMVALSLVLLTGNAHEHWGMKVKTTTEKSQIYSAQDQNTYGVLAYQQLGTSGKEKVFVYKNKQDAKDTTVKKPDLQTTTKIQDIAGNQAFEQTTTKEYVYENGFYQFLFGIAGNNHDVKSKTVIYQVPETWIAMSTADGAKLKAALAQKMGDAEFISWIQQNKQMAAEDPDAAARDAVATYKNILANS
ncbi:DUF4811 domain-containing protein [Fructobacillus sp. M1-13]|uniref:DUF4811 domain-containing protein n=1 Tax=Fructobacillus papyriferae TaxID=2713171 RepID=A0ABS5QS56_9LACO|nr:DUF4811 domain-containing protein [Fructobacillus papyriferae]MBS9335159.1 DUF4811 domain-containing protein [Fructobacillus papyriferae]MCD2159171.1 DUF4811 domain-containing protein [Fructobacillus papyriferae]